MRKRSALIWILILSMLATLALSGEASAAKPFDASKLRGWNERDGYQYVQFGRYPQENGKQPILWRVLAVRDGRALLLSELILDVRPFDKEIAEDDWTANKWIDSSLRQWIHASFKAMAFTDDEWDLVLRNGTAGRILIPSNGELSNPDYGFGSAIYEPDPNRCAVGTSYAYKQGLWKAEDGEYSSYYTRSTGSGNNAFHVNTSGKLGTARIDRTNVGIRPIFWLNIEESLPFTTGTGTQKDPFR